MSIEIYITIWNSSMKFNEGTICDYESSNRNLFLTLSILGLALSMYGYYHLLSEVRQFLTISNTFESELSTSTEFIIQTHSYYILLSLFGLLAIALAFFDLLSLPKAYILVVSNILLMLEVRWLTAQELIHSIVEMGTIQ